MCEVLEPRNGDNFVVDSRRLQNAAGGVEERERKKRGQKKGPGDPQK